MDEGKRLGRDLRGPSAPGGAEPVRKGYSVSPELAYKLRMASARRGIAEVDIVRQALADHLGHGLEGGPWEPLFLPPALIEEISQEAARRGTSPDRLATELLLAAFAQSGEEEA